MYFRVAYIYAIQIMIINKQNLAEIWRDARIKTLITDMFINTADENYLVARWSINNQLEVDFFWSGMHAVEKYLKAILLLNGVPAKKFSHDVWGLFCTLLLVDRRIKFNTRKYPQHMPEDAPERDEHVAVFVKRLAKYGNPNIRYLELGYDIQSADLFKLDNLVWQLRRHCCQFHEISDRRFPNGEVMSKIEAINCFEDYQPFSGRLENIILKNGYLKQVLYEGNYAFDPEGAKSLWFYAAGRSSMLRWTIADLKRSDNDPVRSFGARMTLDWVQKNMPINGGDQRKISELLKYYDNNR